MIQTEVDDRARRRTSPPGTLFGKQFLRLVRLGPYRLDAHLDGTLLIFTHRDVPGLIGFIGTTFGRHDVNIAQMNVGREQPGGEAIGVVNLDSVPPEAALDEVEAAPRHPQRQPDQAPRGRARPRPGSRPDPWRSELTADEARADPDPAPGDVEAAVDRAALGQRSDLSDLALSRPVRASSRASRDAFDPETAPRHCSSSWDA